MNVQNLQGHFEESMQRLPNVRNDSAIRLCKLHKETSAKTQKWK